MLQRMLSHQAIPAPAPPKAQLDTDTKVELASKEQVESKLDVPVSIPEVTAQPKVDSPASVEIETHTEEAHALSNLLTWNEEKGCPVWAENAFEVLLFEVAGLSLAVPLLALGQIVPLNKKLTKLQGQSEWFMGILPASSGDVRTINTALFVMPERYQESFTETAKYVVTIDGMPWGLAVDNVQQPITLQPDDVKWRSKRSKRPWLAGTVKSHMCALIDIPQMASLLHKKEHQAK
ncbi:MAG: chemotaxis protein CheW [Agarilytica sp.]